MLSELDDCDIKILQILQHDCRITAKEMSDKVGKSVTAVHDRIRRLEDSGYILRYVALLDGARIGRGVTGYTTIHLKEHSQSVLRAFEREVIKFPEVMDCCQLTGQADFIIRVVIADLQAYNEFLLNKLATLANIGTVQTSFVLSEAKRETAYQVAPGSEVKKKVKKK
jgi:Lrp/AsnC family leucine-responsive transcriptional regulator